MTLRNLSLLIAAVIFALDRITKVWIEGSVSLWDSYRAAALPHGLRACWSTPIYDGQRRVLGTFALYFRTPSRPQERHLRLIDLCTHTAAIAIVTHRETQALLASGLDQMANRSCRRCNTRGSDNTGAVTGQISPRAGSFQLQPSSSLLVQCWLNA